MKYKLKKAKAIFPYFLSNMENRWGKVHAISRNNYEIILIDGKYCLRVVDNLLTMLGFSDWILP